MSPKQNLLCRSTNKPPRRNRQTGRSGEVEFGKENLATTSKIDDAEIYKYFTNSGRESIDLRDMSFPNHPDLGNEENTTMESHRCHTYPMKKNRNLDTRHRCARCEWNVNRDVCNSCQQNRFLTRSQYGNCAVHDRHHPHLCKSCYYQSICACCRGEICARCNRPTKIDTVAKQSPPRRKLSPRATNLALLEESYEDSSDDDDGHHYIDLTSSRISSPKKDQPSGKPYSFNIQESSMFHPSNANVVPQATVPVEKGADKSSIDDLKRITDEKLSKYARNYGDMRARNTSHSKMIDMEPYRMSLMTQQSTSRKSNESNADRSNESGGGNSFAFKQLETRWQVNIFILIH